MKLYFKTFCVLSSVLSSISAFASFTCGEGAKTITFNDNGTATYSNIEKNHELTACKVLPAADGALKFVTITCENQGSFFANFHFEEDGNFPVVTVYHNDMEVASLNCMTPDVGDIVSEAHKAQHLAEFNTKVELFMSQISLQE